MLKMNWTLSAALLAAAVATTATQANAQSSNYRGSFTLPVEARFGNSVLEPGHYSVSTLDGAKGLRITGDGRTVSILSAGYDYKPPTDNGRLILVNVDGVYALQTFESGSMGKSLTFVVAKGQRNTERAALKKTIEIGLK